MYKFTKGKEMEELKELFEKEKINFVYSKEWGKSDIYIFVVDNFIEKKMHVFADGEFLCDTEIDWEETAKLVKSDVDVIGEQLVKGLHEAAMKCSMKVSDFNKEKNMKKVVVRSWEDFGNIVIKECTGSFRILYDSVWLSFLERDLEKAVKLLNTLGGNFEYQEVEVIDSYEKFHNFLKRLYSYVDDRFFYTFNYEDKNFLQFGCTHHNLLKTFKIQEIEKQFNVDLQILKDGE